MVRPVALVVALAALALGAVPAQGAEEAVPGGPPACSVLVDHSSARAGQTQVADLWVQCNYEVTQLSAELANRKLKRFATPELLGARPIDSMQCRLAGSTRAACGGRLAALARFHARLRVDGNICAAPRLRLSVGTRGGPPCEGLCPEVAFSASSTSSTDPRSMGCGGGR